MEKGKPEKQKASIERYRNASWKKGRAVSEWAVLKQIARTPAPAKKRLPLKSVDKKKSAAETGRFMSVNNSSRRKKLHFCGRCRGGRPSARERDGFKLPLAKGKKGLETGELSNAQFDSTAPSGHGCSDNRGRTQQKIPPRVHSEWEKKKKQSIKSKMMLF